MHSICLSTLCVIMIGVNWWHGGKRKSMLYILATKMVYGGKSRTATEKRSARECTGKMLLALPELRACVLEK